MKLISAELSNYKSVEESGWIRTNKQVTILAGKNNTGKTALIEAIHRITNGSHQNFIADGPDNAELEMIFELNDEEFSYLKDSLIEERVPGYGYYKYRIFYRYDQKLDQSCIMKLQLIMESEVKKVYEYVNKSDTLGDKSIGSYQFLSHNGSNITFHNTPETLIRLMNLIKNSFVYISGNRFVPNKDKTFLQKDLSINGENLNSYLFTLHNNDEEVFNKIINTFKAIFNDVTAVSTPIDVNQDTSICLSFEGINNPVQLFNCGSGFTHVLLFLCVLYSQENRIVLFDEPHVYLHPSAEKAIYDLINETQGHQYILTTHSSILINYPFEKNLYLVNKLDGISNFIELDTVREVLDEIGVSNSDFALAEKVLFVEGPTEEVVIPIILNHFGIRQIGYNYRILKMGGTGNVFSKKTAMQSHKDKLDLILNGIAESPIPYLILIDRDEKDEEKIKNLREKYKNSIQILERREFENYLLDSYEEISTVINENSSEGVVTSVEVERFINNLLERRDDCNLYQSRGFIEEPIKQVIGSRILEALFLEYNIMYNKVVHGKEIVKHILEKHPEKLISFKNLLKDFIQD
ncbi:AAA family ATPase [Bacillus cereus]|nr:AAA family ATPase [Bacillus cereus]MRD42853.1 AAA family ATPase [Bacillus thuringiensis]